MKRTVTNLLEAEMKPRSRSPSRLHWVLLLFALAVLGTLWVLS